MATTADGGGGAGATTAPPDLATKTVTTINLCRNTFNKFIIVTPAVSIDRDCDGAGAMDTVVMEEPSGGLGVSRTIAVVRDENPSNSIGGGETHSSPYSWNQWCLQLAVRCFGSGGSTAAAGTTTKLLQPCQYRRGWNVQRRQPSGVAKCEEDLKNSSSNNNRFYPRRVADGSYEL